MKYVLDFETEKTVDREGKSCYHAWLTGRPDIRCEAATEKEALAILFYSSCRASWDRHFNPDCPGQAQGMWADPIQQAIGLLTGALNSVVKDREGIVLRNINEPGLGDKAKDSQAKGRLSELAGNLGTAIAALARVKHD
jgi:hypothetical protein